MISSVNSMNIQQNMLNASAQRVAKDGVDKENGADLSREMTGQMVAQEAFSANASAVRTQDETTKTLLDVRA